MQKRKALLALMLILFLLAACGPRGSSPTAAPPPEGPIAEGAATPTSIPASPTADRPLAARVNGQPVYLVDYERQVARYEAAMISSGVDLSTEEGQAQLLQLRQEVLTGLIEQVLVEQAAAREGITVSDEEVEAALAQLIEEVGGEEAFQQQLEQNGLTWEEVREGQRATMLYQKVFEWVTASVPATAEHVHARHILVDTREEAEQLLAQLQAGADFAELARQYSQDESSRETGGDLGWFPRGVLLATEVEEAAFRLQAGQISPVVQSPFGYHIIQVLERDPDRPLSPENLQLIKSRVFQEWLENLWAEAQIERFVNLSP
ncbi:MAG TPA: hypothetical protein EYH27_06075 [Anaerolineales bacterium]|nr:hypothetical protein [Anaerolineales bacterium]